MPCVCPIQFLKELLDRFDLILARFDDNSQYVLRFKYKDLSVYGQLILTCVSWLMFADELRTPLKAAMEDLA